MTVPVYAAAFGCIMFSAWISHRVRQRGSIIIGAGAIAIVGYIVLIATHTAGARYAGAFIAVSGIYSANGELDDSSPPLSPCTTAKRRNSCLVRVLAGRLAPLVAF